MDEELKETILGYLKEHIIMTLATVEDGTPWAATLFYANDGLVLYYLSAPTSRHSRNVKENSIVAVTVDEAPDDWRKIKGIQMEGKVELVSMEEELAKAVAAYVAKFPFTAAYLKLIMSPFTKVTAYLTKVLRRLPFADGLPAAPAQFYKVVPGRIRFIDNERDFGHPRELLL